MKPRRKMRRFTRRRRITLFLCAFLVSAALITGSTWAWFHSRDSVSNQLITLQRTFAVETVDVFDPPLLPILPDGSGIRKEVGAENIGEVPAFVRIMALPVIVASDGKTLLPAEIGKEVLLDINTSDWQPCSDGYYYYNKRLEPGTETDFLFTQASISGTAGHDYHDATLRIEIKCEAVEYKKWEYRASWWGSSAAPAEADRLAVDQLLSILAG